MAPRRAKPPATPAEGTTGAPEPAPPRPRRRRRPPQAPAVPDIPAAELTPRVRSAVTRLMGELDRLKDELLAAQERVQALQDVADEDPLVPVLNRRGFLRELERTLAYLRRYGGKASLLFVDLDGFKAVNDRHGHSAGDEALRHVGRLILANVRKSDIVGRLGGDEFAVVLQQASAEVARRKSEQIMHIAASAPLRYAGRAILVPLSAGTVELSVDDTATRALERADRAMYAYKRRRRA